MFKYVIRLKIQHVRRLETKPRHSGSKTSSWHKFQEIQANSSVHTDSMLTYYLLHPCFNTLKHNWPILGQRKTRLVVFLWKRRRSLVVFLATILFLMAIRNNIMAKKTTELVLLFHEKTTNLVFLWPNMGKLFLKVLITRCI